jgi:hypothetical protein
MIHARRDVSCDHVTVAAMPAAKANAANAASA